MDVGKVDVPRQEAGYPAAERDKTWGKFAP